MSILTRPRPTSTRVLFDASSPRPGATFGAGILEPLPRPWTPADHRRAAYFGLKAPAAPNAPARPVAKPTPVPAPSADRVDHRAESVAWKLGFDLARDGQDADLPTGVSERVRASFASGLEAGSRQREADMEATERLEHAGRESCELMEWQAECYA
jgi:hypothetical protein